MMPKQDAWRASAGGNSGGKLASKSIEKVGVVLKNSQMFQIYLVYVGCGVQVNLKTWYMALDLNHSWTIKHAYRTALTNTKRGWDGTGMRRLEDSEQSIYFWYGCTTKYLLD